ncbi:MAG: ATP-binding protein [Gemmatimonadaceae bacterium]|nr:ATP-binding protein [Gemmatimonadaceae bacterium]
MRFQNKRYDQVTAEDIQALIDNRVTETFTMEFKKQLPDTGIESAKEKFVRSVVAMANADGGVILFGVDESDENNDKKGYAVRLHDVGEGVDEATRRVASVLAAKTDPPIRAEIRTHEVIMPGGKRIMVMGVARNLAGPHSELYREQIPRRGERQNYVPRPAELRRMFLETATLFEECEEFVARRLARLTTVPLAQPKYVAVHILPIGRLRESIDVRATDDRSRGVFLPLGGRGTDMRFNAEGLLFRASPHGQPRLVLAHTQLFRFGGLEGVSTNAIEAGRFADENKYTRINGPYMSDQVRRYVKEGMQNLLRHADGAYPYFVSLTLEGVRGTYVMPMQSHEFGEPIDVDRVQANAVVDDEAGVDDACLSLTRILWQAGGWADDFSLPGRA